MIGNINQYVKMMGLSIKANERMEDPFKDKKEEYPYLVSSSENKANKRSFNLSVALTKLETGKKLSYVDLETLRKEDPAAYKKALAIIRERKAYEKKLKQCRTKSEARALQLTKTCSFIGNAKSGGDVPAGTVSAAMSGASSSGAGGKGQTDSSSSSSSSGEGGTFNSTIARLKAAEDVFLEYTKTRAYKKLPVYGIKIKSIRA